jgi:hypothetical protein
VVNMKKIISNQIEVYNEANDKVVEKITDDGFHSIRYRDEYVGGPWVTPTGASAPDVVSPTIAGVTCATYSFDGSNTTEVLCNHFEIPHDLAVDELANGENDIEGNPIEIEMHIHWMPSTTGAGIVKWNVDYCYLPAQGAPETGATITASKQVDNNQYWHFIDAFKNGSNVVNIPAPSTGWHVGDIIRFRLYRNPADDGDTYGADALFIKAALHIPSNDRGSRQRYIK